MRCEADLQMKTWGADSLSPKQDVQPAVAAECAQHHEASFLPYYLDLLSRRFSEPLLNLRHVSVAGHTIRIDPFGHLREQRSHLRSSASARHPGLRINDDVRGLQEPLGQQRYQGELSACGIASRVSHQPSSFHLITVDLCQPIHSILLQLGCLVLPTIPLSIFIDALKAEICGEVHHLHMAGKISDDFLSGGVREAAEGCIDIREVNVGNLYESRHLRSCPQMREDV
mmetsp:Transcript_11238/g.31874  ORF Transcript_11238/g.31874 Transcript_11238/m.31874 type:complete len:228 (+) Transcript_11238:1647-2330(+)